ncbi:MAG: YggS family pyridoxal phosphate-dependent enzyme [Myxococcota bacterium]
MTTVAENLENIRRAIADACKKAGRKTDEVTILAVSKTHNTDKIIKAYNAGQKIFGENYVQEYLKKADAIKKMGGCDDIEWHFIGSLQTNKVKYIVGRTTLIHTVDRLKLAKEIDLRAEKAEIVQSVLVEVNLGGEETKTGVARNELFQLLEEIGELEHLRVEGLMTIPPLLPADEVRPYFVELAELFEQAKIRSLLPFGRHLSMGMSGDFSVAIECGATIVRIGTAIFGARTG